MKSTGLFATKQKRNLFFVFLGLSLAVMCVIFVFSAQNGVESQATSDGLLAKLLIFVENIFKGSGFGLFLSNLITSAIRRMAHGFIYAVLAFSVSGAIFCLEIPKKICIKALFSLLFCLAYAITDEIHQLFVPLRSFEVGDIAVDFIGAFIGTVCFVLIFCIFRAIRKRKDKIS